ncbi:hypothetical protein ACFQX6_53235 [Streptosporangium lutulentum]
MWVLISVLVAAVAHGYAHTLAHHTVTGDRPLVHAARSVLTEWPQVAAALPTVGVLLVAHLGWWNQSTAVRVVLVFNTVTLFGWGMWATRTSGGSWLGRLEGGVRRHAAGPGHRHREHLDQIKPGPRFAGRPGPGAAGRPGSWSADWEHGKDGTRPDDP